MRCVAGAGTSTAGAPPDRYTIANGTVLDTKTGLTWQQAVDPGTYASADADPYCASLSLDGGGWRLPSFGELQTIVDESAVNPSIDATAFPATPVEGFWSAPVAGNPASAWAADFLYGDTNRYGVMPPYRVRCVR